MKDSGRTYSKICTCTDRLSSSFVQKNHERRANFCPNCGTKLTFTQCERCNGTGHGECFICHGFVLHGCSSCSGTGFAPVPHECPPSQNGIYRGVSEGFSRKPPNIRKATRLIQCSACNGEGKISSLSVNNSIGRSVKCLACKGTGWVELASSEGQDESIVTDLPERASLPLKCLACNGTGKISLPSLNSQVDCMECKGKGWTEFQSSRGGGEEGVGWVGWLIVGFIILAMML